MKLLHFNSKTAAESISEFKMESSFIIIGSDDKEQLPTIQDLKKLLENPSEQTKIDAMKTILRAMMGKSFLLFL